MIMAEKANPKHRLSGALVAGSSDDSAPSAASVEQYKQMRLVTQTFATFRCSFGYWD